MIKGTDDAMLNIFFEIDLSSGSPMFFFARCIRLPGWVRVPGASAEIGGGGGGLGGLGAEMTTLGCCLSEHG